MLEAFSALLEGMRAARNVRAVSTTGTTAYRDCGVWRSDRTYNSGDFAIR